MKLNIDSILESANKVLQSLEAKVQNPEANTDVTNPEDNKVDVKFVDAKLNDGSIIHCEGEDFVVGVKAQLLSEDGTLTDLADGNYTLEDGRVLEIMGSVIMTITPDEKEEEVAPVENKVAENNTAMEMVNASLTSVVEKLTAELEKMKSEIESLQKEKVELSSKVVALGKEPGDKPITKSDVVVQDITKLSTAEQYAYIAMQHAKNK